MQAPVGILGGTFNPIHCGHLRSALELREQMGFAEIRLMPNARPPHRGEPDCEAAQRAEMVQLAVSGEPGLACDRRELQRSGASYTYDSLAELRAELGETCSICLIVGADAVSMLNTWYRWEELLQLVHVVAIARPGWPVPDSGVVGAWLQSHRVDDPSMLLSHSRGSVWVKELRQLDISSTEIREMVAAGRSPRYLLPDPVWHYIQDGGLYGYRK
jgi:nicotinate-nucleotide adenylyltransferase